MNKTIKKISLGFVSIALLLVPAAPVLAASSSTLSLSPISNYHVRHWGSSVSALTQSSSENWSGYAATGGNNSFTSVSSTWVEPSVTCTSQTSAAAFWVGLDGFNDQTVEQIGTEANCNGSKAQYYTWYEMYPQNPSEVITNLSVAPGNTVTATVTYNPPTTTTVPYGRHGTRTVTGNPTYTLTLKNITTGQSYTTTQTSNRGANRSSAEVIAEAPYSRGILPLADFNVINYNASTVNGAPLGNAQGLQSITLEDPSGMTGTPSALDTTQEDFSVNWAN